MHVAIEPKQPLTNKVDIQKAKIEFAKLSDEEKEGIQSDFETLYGKDRLSRTREQWKRLVAKYGMPTVIKQEGVTKTYIKAKLKPGKL